MSLYRLRARVDQAEQALETHTATTQQHGANLRARLQRAWPWLWVGTGATVGVITERRMAAVPAAPSPAPATAATQSSPPSLLASLPWGLILGLIDRALIMSDRDAEAGRQPTAKDTAEGERDHSNRSTDPAAVGPGP